MSDPFKDIERESKRFAESVRKEGRRIDEGAGLRAPKPKAPPEEPNIDAMVQVDAAQTRQRQRQRGRASTILARDTLGA